MALLLTSRCWGVTGKRSVIATAGCAKSATASHDSAHKSSLSAQKGSKTSRYEGKKPPPLKFEEQRRQEAVVVAGRPRT